MHKASAFCALRRNTRQNIPSWKFKSDDAVLGTGVDDTSPQQQT
jgi:hypothetical protein